MRPFVPVCYRVIPSDALAYFVSRVGREVYGWDDATTPRTDKPVFFRYRDCPCMPLDFDTIIRRGDRARIPR